MRYITAILKILLSRREKYNDISTFFLRASAKEQEKLLNKVAKEANKDQKALVDEYEKLYPNGV